MDGKCLRLRREMESYFGIDLMSKDRHTENVAMRAAFYNSVLNSDDRLQLTELSRSCGINHATVIHHRDKHEANMMNVNHSFNNHYRYWYGKFSENVKSDNRMSTVHKRMLIGSL